MINGKKPLIVGGASWIRKVGFFVGEMWKHEQTVVSSGSGLGSGSQGSPGIRSHHGKQEVKTHSNQQAQKQKSAYL